MTSVFVIDPTQCFCMFCMPKHKPLLHAEGLSKSCSFLLFNFGRSKTFCESLFSVSACFLFWSNGNNCLSPGQTDLQVRASQCNFAKPELAHRVAMGGQADSQVAKSIIFQTYTVHLWSTCVDWPNSEKLASTCTQSELNSLQFITSGWPNETQVECKLKTCVDLQVCLDRDLS